MTEKEKALSSMIYDAGCDNGMHEEIYKTRCDIHIGKKFFANTNFLILDEAPVTIGDNVFIAPNVGIYTAGHPLDVKRRNQWLEYAYPVTTGNNVWIRAQCVILPGVTIGDDTVVAGSVVNRSLPAGVLAAGNPCRVVRQLDQCAEEVREDFRPKQ